MKNLTATLFATAACLTNSAFAATILGNNADNAINNTPALRTVTDVDELVKRGSNNANARNAVFVFQLPTLSLGEVFSGVSLSFTLMQNGANLISGFSSAGGVAPTYNLDLYGLGSRATSTVGTGDIYFGAAADGTDATLLQADLITSATTVGTVMFSGASLTTYLNAQYAAGAGAGQFIFLRLNPDDTAGGEATNNQNYRVSMANNGTGSSPYSRITPIINFTAVPEPASASVLGLAACCVLLRRYRK